VNIVTRGYGTGSLLITRGYGRRVAIPIGEAIYIYFRRCVTSFSKAFICRP
jgi:hypothetical protein